MTGAGGWAGSSRLRGASREEIGKHPRPSPEASGLPEIRLEAPGGGAQGDQGPTAPPRAPPGARCGGRPLNRQGPGPGSGRQAEMGETGEGNLSGESLESPAIPSPLRGEGQGGGERVPIPATLSQRERWIFVRGLYKFCRTGPNSMDVAMQAQHPGELPQPPDHFRGVSGPLLPGVKEPGQGGVG